MLLEQQKEPKIDYDMLITTREYIPDELYLCKKTDEEDWKDIYLFKFENGFNYVIGSNFRINDVNDIIESLKFDYEIVDNTVSASDLQNYYYENFDNFVKYEDCVKIFNHYKKWSNEIKNIINDYKI